jgi:hypothetical protein
MTIFSQQAYTMTAPVEGEQGGGQCAVVSDRLSVCSRQLSVV